MIVCDNFGAGQFLGRVGGMIPSWWMNRMVTWDINGEIGVSEIRNI